MIELKTLILSGKILIDKHKQLSEEYFAYKVFSMILGVIFWFLVICLLYCLWFLLKQVFFFSVFLLDPCDFDFQCAWGYFVFMVEKEGFL